MGEGGGGEGVLVRLANVPQDLSAANFPFVILGMFSYRSDGMHRDGASGR